MLYPILTETVPLVKDADGVLRVAETRVTLDTVVAAFLDGATAEEITYQYPSLDLADTYSVIAYYLREQAKVNAYLRQRQAHAEQVRQHNEQRWHPAGIRARLLARRSGENV